jgi:hypothetical protein
MMRAALSALFQAVAFAAFATAFGAGFPLLMFLAFGRY